MMSFSVKLDGIGEDALMQCASYLSAEDLFSCCVVNRYMSRTLSHDVLWRSRAKADFGVRGLSDLPPGGIIGGGGSFKQVYACWRKSFIGYPIEMVRRIFLFWTGFETWARQHAPGILSTLAPPASEQDILNAEQEFGLQYRLPLCLRLLYRFHNGQVVPFSEIPSEQSLHSIGWGMFGGTAFYDKLVSMRLLKLSELFEATANLTVDPRSARAIPPGENFYQYHTSHIRRTDGFRTTAFAVNVNSGSISKAYYIADDVEDTRSTYVGGEVYTNTAHFEDLLPCHPIPLAVAPRNGCLLLWLDEYLRRLEEGIYVYQPLDLTEPELLRSPSDNEIHLISLFPVKPLYNVLTSNLSGSNIGATTAITKGVELTACPAFIPEMSNPWRNEFMWSYSIRMRLLQDNPERPAGLNSCQLTHRHWAISEFASIERMNTGLKDVQEVHGEAVIGLYPMLSVEYSQPNRDITHATGNSWPFAYQSCSNAKSYPGSFAGHVDMVPGSKDDPTGPSFQAYLTPFTLSVPDFIY